MTSIALIFLLFQIQPDSSFTNAIEDESTAPYYIIITIVDDSTGARQTICVTANLFLGAIHIEYNIPYDDKGEKRAKKIVLSNSMREYHFKKRESLENMPVSYSGKTLDSLRRKYSKYSNPELRKLFTSRYINTQNDDREAVAHVLVERGFIVRLGDIVGKLFIE